ncbi:MAG: IclR family transcriptional regulator [Microbacteriaceae bacterium]|nr:IclR family transcriptional regulator [Microbacteriaceae bacterium]
MAGRTSEAGASVLARAARLLAALPADGSGATLRELAEGAGLPPSTAHRIAAELVRLGQLELVDGRYAAGTALWELGERAPIVRRLREAANPELTELYDRTGENAHLAVLVPAPDGTGEVLYLARASGARAIPTLARVGVRHPLHATGVGRAILAALPDAVATPLLRGPFAQITPFTITDPARLRAELAATRDRGYALTRQEMTLGNASLALSLTSRAGLPPAAIGVVTHLASADEQRLMPLLRRAASAIEARLDVSA